MLYFDSLSKKSTPDLSTEECPSPTDDISITLNSPSCNGPSLKSPCINSEKQKNEEIETKEKIGIHLHPNSTIHHKYLQTESGKHLDPGTKLADLSQKELEEYLTSFQPAMLGSLEKLASLRLREGIDEDVSYK